MTQITKSDLLTLDYVHNGQPFVKIVPSNTETSTLDVINNGQPFVAYTSSTNIGNIVEFVISLTGDYYQLGYIDVGYYDSYPGITSSISCDLTKFTGVTVEGYSTLDLSSNLESNITLIKDSSITLIASFNQLATISHIEGADLFAFTESQLSLEVSLIKDNNVNVSSVFSLAVDGVRGIYVSAQADTSSYVNVEFLRQRISEAATSAAFSLFAIGNVSRSTGIDLTSDFLINLNVDKFRSISSLLNTEFLIETNTSITKEFTSSLDVNFNLTSFGSRTSDINLIAFSNASLTTNAVIISNVSSNLDINSNLNSVNQKIAGLSSSLDSIFQIECVGSRSNQNTIDCTINTDLICNCISQQSASANINSNLSIIATPETIISSSIHLNCTSSIVIKLDGVKENNANLYAEGFIVSINGRLRPGIEFINVESNLDITCNITKPFNGQLNVLSSVNSSANRIRNSSSTLINQFNLVAIPQKFVGQESLEVAPFTLTANVKVIKEIIVSLPTITNIIVNPRKDTVNTIHLQVQAFNLILGRQIQLATAELWRVKPDNNYWKIPRDINLDDAIVYRVPHETRGWKIPQETNYYTVEFENRSYKIKG